MLQRSDRDPLPSMRTVLDCALGRANTSCCWMGSSYVFQHVEKVLVKVPVTAGAKTPGTRHRDSAPAAAACGSPLPVHLYVSNMRRARSPVNRYTMQTTYLGERLYGQHSRSLERLSLIHI